MKQICRSPFFYSFPPISQNFRGDIVRQQSEASQSGVCVSASDPITPRRSGAVRIPIVRVCNHSTALRQHSGIELRIDELLRD